MTGLLLGIDTGGTYTDGVLLDADTRRVLATSKTLTTHQDLRLGILQVLDDLLPDDPSRILLVSISTTLATNAIAEGRGRPVGLCLIGYDRDLVARYRLDDRFSTPHFAYIQGGHDLQGREQSPLDLEGLLSQVSVFNHGVEAFAVSGYFSPLNPEHEETAAEAIRRQTGRPVVQAHHLSGRLDSIQRATTAALNASLLPILEGFVNQMEQAVRARNIAAPVMMVRCDGALTLASNIRIRPVETVHSGPAASAIGGRFLSGREDALVIDIGGTTTDLAVLQNGQVTVREEGTTVGGYRTAVRAAEVRSIGLGGDSRISYDRTGRLQVGPARRVPVSLLAYQDPRMAQNLRHLDLHMRRRPSPDFLEFWFLAREPAHPLEHPAARQALKILRDGPLPLAVLLERLGVYHPLQFDGQGLLNQGLVGVSGLTPTDLLHVRGEFTAWNLEAAGSVVRLFARLLGMPTENLIDQVLEDIAGRIVREVVFFLSGRSAASEEDGRAGGGLGNWMLGQAIRNDHPLLGMDLRLDVPLIGLGAPAGALLPRVAELLHTGLILPPHYAVANAVGAVAGNVMVQCETWVLPEMEGVHLIGYNVQGEGPLRRFERLQEACDYAEHQISVQALARAREAGATQPHLEVVRKHLEDDSVYLKAQAVGNPQLGRSS